MDLEEECVICFESQVCKMLYKSCGHTVCVFCYEKMKNKCCPLCCVLSDVVKTYYSIGDLKFIGNVEHLYDRIVTCYFVAQNEVTQLLIEYIKWLKLVAKDNSLIPSVLINMIWMAHISDTDDYTKTCNNLGFGYVQRNVNTNGAKIMYNIIGTKICYKKLYGDDMLGSKFWRFDERYDIGTIIGFIRVKSINGSVSLNVPFTSTMTCKHLKMIIENDCNQRYGDKLILIFHGKSIPNDAILSQKKIKIYDVIYVAFPFR